MSSGSEPAPTGRPTVAFIVCSMRQPRSAPQIRQFVEETLRPSLDTLSFTPNFIDLADWPLPLFNEPVIPSWIHSPADYHHEHTRRWSAEISKHAGYVFITPQYNWGYPASVKNAIDYLFNEWTGKPGAIISYGGRGGGKAAAQLSEVLQGLRMKVVDTMPALAFGSEGLHKIQKGEPLGVVGPDSLWNSNRADILKAMNELGDLLPSSSDRQEA